MNYKHISSKQVIAKIYRDLKPSGSSWTSDALEWIGEALDFIGYHGMFDHVAKELTVENHKAEIPCDLYQLIQIEHEGTALVYGTDTTGYNADSRTTSATPTNSSVYTVAVAETNPTDDHSSPAFTLKFTKDTRQSNEYYLINGGYIVTSFEEGTIKLHYTAYPTDSDGFPMVPDNIYVKQALEWYIIRQMMMGGYVHPVFDWGVADRQWGHYCVAAQNDLAFPSIDKMETMKNMFVRMVPMINRHSDFFIGNETQERLDR
jgi:hypothetical protein